MVEATLDQFVDNYLYFALLIGCLIDLYHIVWMMWRILVDTGRHPGTDNYTLRQC